MPMPPSMTATEAPAPTSTTGDAVPDHARRGGRRLAAGIRRLLGPATGTVATGAVMAADMLLGDEVTISVLHVGVVAAVAWLGSRAGALFVAAVAGLSVAAIGTVQGSAVAAASAAAVLLAVLVTTAVGVSRVRDTLAGERRAAEYDSLTGALSSHGFDSLAERARHRALRDGRHLSVAYIDLDDFKAVNDAHGRDAGDDLLVRFAATVSASVRATDVFARIGGDRFLLLTDTNARQALLVAERVRAILREACEGFEHPVTASIGVATYRNPPDSVEELVVGADGLMYEAKARGGDAIVSQLIVGSSTRWDLIETGDDAFYSGRETA
jgi:diguanylate cyclase (GGDEF)-like protein